MKLSLTSIISIIAAVFGIFVIFFINYQIIGNWFGGNGPANFGSIEVSYVSMARFLKDFGLPFFGATWNPLWYFGFPTHVFYTPLLPFLELFLHSSFNMSLWEAYRFVTGWGYILGPISVFFLGWQLSKNVVGGIIAGVLYSIAPTLFYWLDSGVAGDKISLDFWDPRRFTILVRWGEGPHIFSLIFVPLVGVFFVRFLHDKKFSSLFFASICLGLTALSNAIGLFAALLLVASITFVKFAQSSERKNVFFSAVLMGILSLGLISFWYNISFISNFFGEGEGTGKMYLNLFPWGWVGTGVGVVIVFFLFQRVIKNFGIAVSLMWFLLFFTVVYIYYTQGLELLPQALRYNVEVDLSLSLLLGVSVAGVVEAFAKRMQAVKFIGIALCIPVAILAIAYIQPFVSTAERATGAVEDIKKFPEYQFATWFNSYVDQKKGERVIVPGNYSFYLNWLSNVWQLRGGLFQAQIHPWPDHIYYQLGNGTDPDIANAWLEIANVKYLVIAGRDVYRDFKNTVRFEEYPIVYPDQGDVIYKVPLEKESMAKPVNLSDMESLIVPKKGDDKRPILDYANWINKSPSQTEFTVIDHDTYQISGEVGSGEGILVQMSGDSAWSAFNKVSQQNIRVSKDPLGFIVLYPDEGKVDITLKHGKPADVWIGYFITLVTIIGIIWYTVIPKKKHAPAQAIEAPAAPSQPVSVE